MDKKIYTPEMCDKMKLLSSITALCDLNKPIVCVKTKKFDIINTYLIPFVYSNLISDMNTGSNFTSDEIEEIFSYYAKELAIKNILFYEALDLDIRAENKEMEEHIKTNNIDFTDKTFSREFLYNEIIKTVVINKYLEKIIYINLAVTDKELEDYYISNPSIGRINKRAVVRYIRITYKKNNDNEKVAVLKTMENLLILLDKGQGFSQLAKKYSDDIATSNSGGLAGNFVEQGETVEYIDNIIFNLHPGKTSGIIDYQNAYYIFKLEKFINDQKESLNEVKDEITSILIKEKKQALLNKEILRLKKKYNLSSIFD